MDDFMLRAALAGTGIALATGPLGVFIVWRRLSYFGDTLAHTALFGVTLGLIIQIPIPLAIMMVCIAVALLLFLLESRTTTPSDTALGILSHSTLALALVVISLAGNLRVDLSGYLFGDVLACSWQDVYGIFAATTVVFITLIGMWRPLLNSTVQESLAQIDGVSIHRIRILFMLLVAITVAMALKIVGALLISALLVIPAAAARFFSFSPGIMAVIATLIAMTSVGLGLTASLQWDTPSGPSIVLATGLFFMLGLAKKLLGKHA